MYKFDKDAVVSFFGDSITANGMWYARMLDYYREIYPGAKIKMFNGGSSGGTTTGALKRFEVDISRYNPTDVVVMFGMNDIGHNLYSEMSVTEDTLNARLEKLEKFEKNLFTIADYIKGIGANVIFCTPTPTDPDQICGNAYNPGPKLGLEKASEIVKKVAQCYGGHVVDFQSELWDMMNIVRMENLHNNLIRKDRVHPNEIGQEIMGKIFLRAQGFDVPMFDKMSDWENEQKKPLSKHTKDIFDLEFILRALSYVEWGLLKDTAENEKEKKLKELLESEDSNDFVISRINMYHEHIAHKKEIEDKVIAIS